MKLTPTLLLATAAAHGVESPSPGWWIEEGRLTPRMAKQTKSPAFAKKVLYGFPFRG